jgi:hypothetical protein
VFAGPWLNGIVSIYGLNNTLVSSIEVAKYLVSIDPHAMALTFHIREITMNL